MSIKNKIIGYYSLTFAIIFIVVILLSTLLIRNYLYKDIKSNLVQEANMFSYLLLESIKEEDDLNPTLLSLLVKTRAKSRTYQFESTVGYLIYNKETNTILNKSAFLIDEADDFLISSIIDHESDIDFSLNNVQYFGVVKNIGNSKTTSAVLSAARKKNLELFIIVIIKDSEVKAFIKDTAKKQLAILIVAFIFMIVLGYFIGNSITKPLRKLNTQAKEMAKRNYRYQTNIVSKNEIGELSDTINNMAVALNKYELTQNRFLQNASHELKTPLMSIKGYAEGMVDGLVEKNVENLTIIIEESDRLKKIVEGISLLSKIESKNDYLLFDKVAVNDVIKKAILKINGLAVKEHIEMDFKDNKQVLCEIDEDSFVQALLNIYSNCIRYASSYVKTYLSVEDCVKITIIDDGNGIKENDLPYIFERFYKGESGENGLGLAITKAIVEKHNGTVIGMNDKKAGAKFVITLPYDRKLGNDEL